MKKFSPPKLNITSMMDMFTIILIFLLFSFSNEPETMQLDKNLRLPHSNSESAYKENVKLVLTQESLKFGDKTVATLKDGHIQGLNPNNLKGSRLFTQFKFFLKDIKKTDEGESYILLLCDKRLEFKTINLVVKTAALAGYPNFKFAVLGE